MSNAINLFIESINLFIEFEYATMDYQNLQQ